MDEWEVMKYGLSKEVVEVSKIFWMITEFTCLL